MQSALIEWLNFLVRWVHVIAGISWIGNSFYFMWMDSAFEPVAEPRPGVDGELYMVHGGNYYHVEKQKIRPEFLPKTLHWFKWEATFTWISGFALLTLLYYFTGGIYLIDQATPIQSPVMAVAASLALIFGSWFVYDFFWQSKLAQSNTKFATGVSLGAACALSYLLCRIFTGRGAFLHLGAIFATLMVINVWIRILPRQQKMLDDAKDGKIPDYNSGTKAKQRSTHNSYMTLPVLFMMLSNHFSLAYGGSMNWVILILLCVLGGVTRHMMLQWNKGSTGAIYLIPIGAVTALLVVLTALPAYVTVADSGGPVSFVQAHEIIEKRCVACHSQHPTDALFKAPPNGVMFEDPAVIRKFAAKIKERVFVNKTMPLINRTQITDAERSALARWVDGGAKLE